MLGKQFLSRMILTTALGGGLFLASAAVPALADRDWSDDCHKRLEEARARLDRDVARHGEQSRQVERDRVRMEDARRWCRDRHADWDHDRFDAGAYTRR
jgi:hypothetical protein